MNDVRSFLRYVLPGIIYLVLVGLSLAISTPSRYFDNYNKWASLGSSWAVLGATLIAAGLGYLFSIIYFFIINRRIFERLSPNNYQPALRFMEKNFDISFYNNDYKVMDLSGKCTCDQKLDRKGSWVVLQNIWTASQGYWKDMYETDKFVDRITNVLHGLGATMVATLMAFLTWCLVVFSCLKNSEIYIVTNLIIVLAWISLFLIIFFNFLEAREKVERLINSAAVNAVYERMKKTSSVGGEVFYIK